MKHKIFTVNKPNIMKEKLNTNNVLDYLTFFIVSILVPYPFWFSY